jgi:virginiamycin B lyase
MFGKRFQMSTMKGKVTVGTGLALQTTIKRKVTIGVGLVLVIIVSSMVFVPKLLLLSKHPTSTAHALPQYVRTAAEIIEPGRSAQSTVTNQAPTTSSPWGIAFDELRGFVWVAEPGCTPLPTCSMTFPTIIGKYSQADGRFIQDFQEPAGYSSPLFVAVDAQGNVWFTQPDGSAIGELNPQTDMWQQWALPKDSVPYDLTFDKQGNLWFTEFGADKIGFLNTQTHQIVENQIPTPDSNPYGMTIDKNGTIWFTENREGVAKIASFTPTASGQVTIIEHAVPVLQPHLITSDHAGNIWFSGAFEGVIGEFDPATGATQTYAVSYGICPVPATPANCPGTHISGITVDKKGNIWFTDSLDARVGYVVPATGKVEATRLSRTDAHPHDGLAVDNYGTLWFTEEYAFALVMWPSKTIK